MRKSLLNYMVFAILMLTCLVYATVAVPPKVALNGKDLMLTMPPVFEGKEVLMPVKDLVIALGGTITWINESQTLIILKDGQKIGLKANLKTAQLNGKVVGLNAPVKLIKNRMYAPARFICENLGSTLVYDVTKKVIRIDSVKSFTIMKDEPVGARLNDTDSGAWWGENITKIVRTTNTTFTSVLSSQNGPRMTYLYEKTDKGAWVEGEAIATSRPANILADSLGYIHVIAFEPINANDAHNGRIIYMKFDKPNTVRGTYQKTYLTQGTNKDEKSTQSNYGSLFCGAAIGKDNTIMVVYDNTLTQNQVANNSLGTRIFNPVTAQWTYETVKDNMASRYCYPFAFVSEKYYHVLAVEDMFDPDYALLKPPHNTYQFRYGAVKHFQRLRTGGAWVESTLLDFNNKPNIGKQQIADAGLRIMDFTVDSSGRVHAVLKFNGNYKGDTLLYSLVTQAYDYIKLESQSNWQQTRVNFSGSLNWAKIWECSNNKNYYLVADYLGLYLVPADGGAQLDIIKPIKNSTTKPSAPFITSKRSGSPLSNILHIIRYTQPEPTVAQYMEVSLPVSK